MSLLKKYSRRSSLTLLAMIIALVVPTAASAHFFFAWWLQPISSPIADIPAFDLDATNGKLYNISFQNRSFSGFEKLTLQDASVTASIANEQLTIPSLTLTDGSTTAVLTFSTIDLQTDLFGSSFRSDVTINVTPPSASSYNMTGRIFGRITESSGNYNLRANIGGVYLESLGSGSFAYHLLRTTLSGSVAVP